MRSCSFSSDTDFGRRLDIGKDDNDDDDVSVVDAMVVGLDVSISIPSMEEDAAVDDVSDERRVSELAKFILKVRQSPRELGSIDSSSSVS